MNGIRTRIEEHCTNESPFPGHIEVDESYFGPRCVKEKHGRGAGDKTIVFGIFKWNGKVYTEIVPDVRRKPLQNIIRGRIELESIIHSDGWRGYSGLVDFGYKKHFRVRHSQNEFANKKTHINGIESFCGYAKTRLAKFREIRKELFNLHLKECEFRFNYRHEKIYETMLKICRNNHLF